MTLLLQLNQTNPAASDNDNNNNKDNHNHQRIQLMPRFSKPVVEDENGELIIPGAYEAQPGGFCERRSTFEWDNDGRALINVDELSVDLSNDSDNEDDHVSGDNGNHENNNNHNHNNSNGSRSSSSREQSRTTTRGGDEEQGVPFQLPAPPPPPPALQLLSREIQNPNAPLEASVVHVAEEDVELASRSSNTDGDDAANHKIPMVFFGIKHSTWIKLIMFILFWAVGFGVIVFWKQQQQQQQHKGVIFFSSSNNNNNNTIDPFAPPSQALAYRTDLGLQEIVSSVVVDSSLPSDDYSTNSKLQPDWRSPYYQALYWLLYQDPLQVTLETHNATLIQQRFIMATFYFATSLPAVPSSLDDDDKHNEEEEGAGRQRPLSLPQVWKQCAASSNPNMLVSSSTTTAASMAASSASSSSSFSSSSSSTEISQAETTGTNNATNATTTTTAQLRQQMQCTHQQLVNWNPRQYVPHPDTWRWLSAASECLWAGVECNAQGYVTAIVLGDYGLQGTLVEELGKLPSLRVLSLPHNGNLAGRVPSILFNNLQRLELHFNRHDGSLEIDSAVQRDENENENDNTGSNDTIAIDTTGLTTPTTSNSTSTTTSGPLTTLNLAGNNFTGSLPSNLGLMTNLRVLLIERNELTGTLPGSVFSKLTNLIRLRLNHNQLQGSIPVAMLESSVPSVLQELDLSGNSALTGTIPSQIGLLQASLKTLGLANGQFTGMLPLELYNLTQLSVLDISDNSFSGVMSTLIGKLRNLQTLYWQDNQFYGELPTELGNLAQIADFQINGNDFEGTVPSLFCDLHNEVPLAYKTVVVADCGPEDDLTNNSPKPLYCPQGCCSSCCKKSTGTCNANPNAVLGFTLEPKATSGIGGVP